MRVLLSIKPEFVDKILSGEKLFEFRKNLFKNKNVDTVVIYSTMPIGKVVGEFTILSIIQDKPENIWRKTKKFSGISKHLFDKYYSERDKAIAIEIGGIRQYNPPLTLQDLGKNIVPPQSYRYLD